MVGGIIGGGAIYAGLEKLAEAIKKTKIDTFVEIGTRSYAGRIKQGEEGKKG